MSVLTDTIPPAYLTLAVLAVMFVLFVMEVFAVEVTAMLGAAAVVVLGLVPADGVLEVFANPAPWTIAAMFVVSAGLVRTGLIGSFAWYVSRRAADRKVAVICGVGLIVGGASAFTNNTPLVAVMIPVAVQLAHAMGISPSKLLIPLSYQTVLGGMISMIGTSTNILVDGVARSRGLAPFGLFEIAPLGLVVGLVGFATMWLLVPRFLPDRETVTDLLGARKRPRYFTEVIVPESSPLIGVLAASRYLGRDPRAGRPRGPEDGDAGAAEPEGSRQCRPGRPCRLHPNHHGGNADPSGLSDDRALFGAASPAPPLRRLPACGHRRSRNIARQLDDVVIQVGDTLLLEGAPDDIRRLATDMRLADFSEPTDRPFRRDRAPLVLAVILGIVVLSAFDIAPIQILAMLGVVALLATRTLEPQEAYATISAPLILLILSMLVVGDAMDRSGAAQLVVDGLQPWLSGLPPMAVLFVLYFLTQVLTELLSNNAVAVIVTPVAITLAQSLGLDPRPLVVAVMFAATLAFATPIGYQTNTMVYGPGGYRFTDFTRIGLPLNIVTGITACVVIPLIWPL